MIWLQIDVFRKSQSILLNVYIQVLFSWSMHVYQLLHKQDRGFVKKIIWILWHLLKELAPIARYVCKISEYTTQCGVLKY